MKFALRNYKGEPVEFYIVDERTPPQAQPVKEVGHLIMVLDRSGSMWGDKIRDAKATIEKVFTLEEFHNADLLVSLISYSSSGDLTVHFGRTPVQEIMKPGNKYVEQIRMIQATYLTCASQAVEEALKLVGTETTCIALETDGYFNDPSPLAETRRFDKLVETIRMMKNVMLNSIAFGSYTDFNLLSKISNSCSGKAVVAVSIKEVYETLHDTAALLTGAMLPAVVVPLDGADYQTAYSVNQRKVNGTTADLKVMAPGADLQLYRYRRVTEAAWTKDTSPEISSHPAVYAMARSLLAEGKINKAKYALVATRNSELLRRHAKALTVEALSDLAAGLEAALYNGAPVAISSTYGLATDQLSIIETCELLSDYNDGFTVDLNHLNTVYRRRGLRKLAGEWVDIDGKKEFKPVGYRVRSANESSLVRASAFEINNQNATINMRLTMPAKLERSNGDPVPEVAGVPLASKLKMHRNYTLVSDGAANIDVLPIRISSKELFAELKSGKLVEGEFDHTKVYELPFRDMTVAPFNQEFDIKPEIVQLIAKTKVMRSMIAALGVVGLKGEETWSEAQLEELKAHYLSPSLSFQAPSANHYTDQKVAVQQGLIDSRTGYSIAVGTPEILSLTDLYSANEYLARRYKLRYTGTGEREGVEKGYAKKPKMSDLLTGEFEVEHKTLTAQTKLNTIDDLMFPIFEAFLKDKAYSKDIVAMKSTLDALDSLAEDAYDKHIRPLAFYIGSSGLMPDNWEGRVELLTDETFAKHIPNNKQAKDTAYYLYKSPVGPVVISLKVENTWYSTELGLAAAKTLQAGDVE